jgi:hypothetical protein
MNRNDIIALGQARHGTNNWIGPFASDLDYSFSQLWRVKVHGRRPF